MMRRSLAVRGVMGALALALGACVRVLDEGAPTAGARASDCALPLPPGVTGWGVPASIPYDDGPLWVFDAVQTPRGGVDGAAVRVRDAETVCTAGPELLADSAGPVSLLRLTAAEEAASAARTDGRRLALVPRAGFVQAGVGYLYYDVVLTGGARDPERFGTGLCRFDRPDAPCTRLTAQGDSILWWGDALPVASALVASGSVQLLLCRVPAAFEQRCTWARAPVIAAADPAAYVHHDAFEGWVPQASRATTALADVALPSARWSAARGQLAVFLADPFDARFTVRLADGLEAVLGERQALFSGTPPSEGALLLAAAEQPTLSAEDGRLLRFLYASPQADGLSLRLASVRLEEPLP